MTNTKKIIGLKRAVGEYRRANRNGHLSPEYGYLMFDRSTGELWTDFFSDFGHGSFEEYYDPNIILLKVNILQTNGKKRRTINIR